MAKNLWKNLAEKWPIVALAPMDWYTDSPYRQIVKRVNPDVVVFSEFYSADWLVHSKELQRKALTHDPIEYPLVVQIFGKNPETFAEAAKIIESYGIDGVDVNMGCPAKKVVKSGHGSSLMIDRETAFRSIEAMAKAVSIPVSVKTRLWWEDTSLLSDFCRGLKDAGADLISIHGRTYKQAFTGRASFWWIFALKNDISVPILANWDIVDYDDGIEKIRDDGASLSWFMIGRASFGNPWCFLPRRYTPPLYEVLDMMELHGKLLYEWKGRRWMLEARKHLVQYIHGLEGAKEYRSSLVQVQSAEDIKEVLTKIREEQKHCLNTPLPRKIGFWNF